MFLITIVVSLLDIGFDAIFIYSKSLLLYRFVCYAIARAGLKPSGDTSKVKSRCKCLSKISKLYMKRVFSETIIVLKYLHSLIQLLIFSTLKNDFGAHTYVFFSCWSHDDGTMSEPSSRAISESLFLIIPWIDSLFRCLRIRSLAFRMSAL